MKGTNLGEFEEIVLLTVAALVNDAYSVAICDELEKNIGRPARLGVVHAVLNRLEEKGYVKSIKDAFTRYIGEGKPAYARKDMLSPVDAIQVIHQAGGFGSPGLETGGVGTPGGVAGGVAGGVTTGVVAGGVVRIGAVVGGAGGPAGGFFA